MSDAAHYGTFFVAALTLAVLPGPGQLYVLARSLGGGWREGARSALGTAVGGGVHVLLSAVGLSALVLASSVALSAVKYAGAAYLISLGIRTLLARKEQTMAGAAPTGGAFRQGIVTELLNPKTALFFLAFIPQFIRPEAGHVFWQFVALGTMSVVLNTLAALANAAVAGRLGNRLRVNARFQRRSRLASGGAMIGLGVYAAVER